MNHQTKQPQIQCNLSRREALFKAGEGFAVRQEAYSSRR